MGYVNRAWNEGSVRQTFEYTPETRDIYRPDRAFVFLNVLWQRVGNFVVEVGTDFSELRGMELDLENQRLAVIEASRARTMAQQREQIARDLHDSTVQQLFAACLFIESMVKTLDTFRDRGGTEGRVAAGGARGSVQRRSPWGGPERARHGDTGREPCGTDDRGRWKRVR